MRSHEKDKKYKWSLEYLQLFKLPYHIFTLVKKELKESRKELE